MKKKKLTKIFLIRKDLLKILMIMKIAILLTIVSAMNVFATAYSQATKLNLHLENASLEQIFVAIEDQSEFKFLYHDKLINDDGRRKADYRNKTVEEILDDILSGTNNTYTVLENNLVVITPKQNMIQQGFTVTGKVVDSEGDPLPGVNIVVQGTTTGAVSDLNGNYTVTVPNEKATLVFSFVGYLTEEVSVNGQSNIDLTLVEDVQSLEEVVVIGYGAVKKSDLTGSVTQVKSEDIAAYPATAATQAIQGRAAGVQVSATNGEPGSSYRVRIRGGTSINSSSDPLIVVDGLPGGTWPPPEDIESLEILKDASATAIYGSRGANGVILIQTKRGEAGRTKINFSSSFSRQTEIDRFDLLNAQEMAAYVNETRLNSSDDPDNEILPYDNPASYGEGTDWQDEVLRNGGLQNYQLALSGGNEAARFYVSGTIYDQKGVILNSDYNRYSVTSNLDITALKKVKIGANLFAQRSTSNGVRSQEGSGGTNNAGVISSAFKFEPTQPVFDENGDYTLATLNDPHDNPVAIALEPSNETINDRLQANFFTDIDLLEGLTVHLNFAGNIYNQRDGAYTPTTLNAAKGTGGNGQIDSRKNTRISSENYITYSNNFGDVHDISVMGGYSYESAHNEFWRTRAQTFTTDAGLFWNLEGGSTLQTPSSNLTETELSSFYGRLNYKLLNRYLITINGRYDGSSKFAKNNKWAFFPSGALAWNVAEEAFMQNIDQLSQLKLRASYGVTGNQAIGAYQSLAKFGTVTTIIGDNIVNAVRPTSVANENLTWESTEQMNVGFDLGLFNLRLLLTADYYNMETFDLLFSQPLPPYSGYGSQLANIGRVENKGFEFSLTSVNFRGEFEWETNFNVSTNKNKILELPDDNKDIFYSARPGHMVGLGNTHVLRVGEPVASMFGYVYDGVYQTDETPVDGAFDDYAGGRKFKDIASTNEEGEIVGEPDNELTSADRTIIGNPHPDFIFGFNNTFNYKGFDLNIFLQGSQGNDLYSFSLMELDLMSGQNNATTEALNRWTPANTDTDVPVAHMRPRVSTDRFIYDGSYIRLKNLSLGYNVPQNVIGRVGIRSLRVYISGQNILTISDYPGIDPEVNYRSGGAQNSNRNLGLDYGSYPNIKSYTIGFNIGL